MVDERDTPVGIDSGKVQAGETIPLTFHVDQTDYTENFSPAQTDPLVGTTIAQTYEVVALLGKGGMSTVYLARHLIMKKFVAIKLLHTHLLDNEVSVKRFKQEAQTATKLDHPNIIRILDCQASLNGQPYMVMDFVDGETLAATIGNTKLTLDQSIDIFLQVCEGLNEAHKHGIIHRDLKPSNVMLTKGDQSKSIAKVVDFGIAKLLPQEAEAASGLTRTGETFGSPLYMSPEQCLAMPLDVRTDIYSLGCLMFEVISGNPPFCGGNIYETIYKQINEAPPNLAPFITDKQRRDPLERIVLKCLAKEREHRYKDMGELIRDLKLLEKGDNKGVVTRVMNAWELQRLRSTPKDLRARKVAVLLCATAVSVALVLLVGNFIRLKHEAIKLSGAMALSQNEILWIEPFVAGDLGDQKKIDRFKFFNEQHIRALSEILDETHMKNQPEELFKMYVNSADFYMKQGAYQVAADYWSKALVLAEQDGTVLYAKDRLAASRGLAVCQYRQEQWLAARDNFGKALEYLRPFANVGRNKAMHPASEIFSQLIASKGDCEYRLAAKAADADKRKVLLLAAYNDFDKAVTTWGKFGQSDTSKDGEIALCMSKMGDVERRLAELTSGTQRDEYLREAESHFQVALEKWTALKGSQHLYVGLCLNYLAIIDTSRGRYAEADEEFVRARKIVEMNKGNDDVYLANLLGNHARLLEKRFKLVEMMSTLEQAERIRHKLSRKQLVD